MANFGFLVLWMIRVRLVPLGLLGLRHEMPRLLVIQ